VVELINKRSRNRRFTQKDLRSLLRLLGPIAVSLNNAILFQETQKLTITDDLTKLYNNRYINQCLAGMIDSHKKKSRCFGVIFLDLDGFKSVNDRYGHLVGGETLVEVGRIIFHTVRDHDIVARYGGDEFVVLMPDTEAEEAVAMAESIRIAIQSHNFLNKLGREIQISASFGISVFPDHANDLTGLIQKADNAMYAVKYSGKNAVQIALS
jgi:diguanylate cyclase (GGDEF)-like protein